MPSNVFEEIANYSERLDCSLRGEAYLNCAQKQSLDRFGASVLFPLITPLASLARLAVWAEDRQPTIVGLPRVGKDGDMFFQFKIRSMVAGSELQDQSLENSDSEEASPTIMRTTRVGKFLRRLSIDELPQFYNIIQGDMSLVGSRPKSALEHVLHAESDPDYDRSYCLGRPGLTGFEQINGRKELDAAARISFINQYAKEACLELDADILRKTARNIFNSAGSY